MNKELLGKIIEKRVAILIVIISVSMAFIEPSFLGFKNILSVFMKISIEGVIVIGMTYLIILKEIDLSVGESMGLSAFFAILLQPYGVIAGVLAGLLCGVIIGFLNGTLVVKFKLPSIAVTLGMMILINGLIFVFTKSDSVAGSNKNFKWISHSSILGIPGFIIIMILLVVFFHFFLRKTRFGRNIYAVGGNEQASRYANIPVDKIRLSVFVITGAMTGLAGVLLASRYNVASGAIGATTPIFVITAVLIGGVSLAGGEGTVLKAFQGLLLVSVIENAMIALGLYSAVKLLVMGTLLIITLVIDSIHVEKEKYK